jgi:Trypsin
VRWMFSAMAFFALAAVSGADAGDFLMKRIPDNFGAAPKILGGKLAHREDWPATLIFTSASGERCTSTVIGDQILITAAHCVAKAPSGIVVWNNRNVRVQCTTHPKYDDSPAFDAGLACHQRVYASEIAACTADVALCRTMNGAVFSSSVGRFERVKSADPAVVEHSKILLLGYGCVDANTKATADLSTGEAEVLHTSIPGASANPAKSFDEFIQTKGAGVCYGDSGGAGYTNSDPKSREIVGINSRGNLSNGSSLVNVKDPRINKFLTDFSSSSGALICGLDTGAKNCAF